MNTIEPIDFSQSATRVLFTGQVRMNINDGGAQYCEIEARLLNDNNDILRTQWVGLTKEQADAWGADDSIIATLACSVMGWVVNGTVE